MYEDAISAILFDLQQDPVGARVNALRGQPPPGPPMGGPPGMPPPGPPGPPGPGGPPPMAQPPMPPSQPTPMAPPRPQMPRQGPALPRTMAQAQPPQTNAPAAVPGPLPGGPPQDDLLQRQQALMGEYQQALQPPDRGASEAAYQKRAQEGPRMLLHALAAERAGKGDLAKQYYGQAREMQAPMKMAGGTMTPEGFIQDPGYAQEFKLRKIEAQMAQNDRIIASNAVRQDKLDAEKRNADLRREMAEFQRGTAVQLAGMRNPPADPLQAVVGPDGNPTLVPRSQAAGMQPYYKPPGKGGANDPADAQKAKAELPGLLDQAERALPSATGSGAGKLVDAAAGFFGKSLPGAEAAAQLKVIAGKITSRIERMPGAVSNADLLFLKEQAGQLGDESLPIGVRLAALKAVRETMNRNKDGGATGDFGGGPPPPPRVGEVRGGYTFKGGNPADPNSWSK